MHAPLHDVWIAFTTKSGAETFFAPKAHIELRLQGPYEIFFNPADERQGTKGLKILSYAPERMLSMQWNAPPELQAAREAGMWVVIDFQSLTPTSTSVRISHLGWQEGPGWLEAYPHFVQGWHDLLNRLVRRFDSGPIDWATEPMMWKK